MILARFLRPRWGTSPSGLPGLWQICVLLRWVPCPCASLLFSLPFRCFSGFHCWNAAAAHLASACWSYYDHRLPWRDPNEDAEDACFASCCFQSGHRWVRYISCFMCCCKKLLTSVTNCIVRPLTALIPFYIWAIEVSITDAFCCACYSLNNGSGSSCCFTTVSHKGGTVMLTLRQPNLQVISAFRSWNAASLTIGSGVWLDHWRMVLSKWTWELWTTKNSSYTTPQ